MYELTIEKILTTDKKTSKIFLGAFVKDEVPEEFKFPACFIANLIISEYARILS